MGQKRDDLSQTVKHMASHWRRSIAPSRYVPYDHTYKITKNKQSGHCVVATYLWVNGEYSAVRREAETIPSCETGVQEVFSCVPFSIYRRHSKVTKQKPGVVSGDCSFIHFRTSLGTRDALWFLVSLILVQVFRCLELSGNAVLCGWGIFNLFTLKRLARSVSLTSSGLEYHGMTCIKGLLISYGVVEYSIKNLDKVL